MTKKQKKMLIRICIAIVLLLIAKFVPMPGAVRIVLFAVTYLVIGYDILKKAAKGIGNGRVFDENFLMAIATLGAIALAVYEKDTDLTEAVAVMLFYQIGELFQSYAVGKSRRNITALMDIRPDYANIETDGKLEQVDPDTVAVGSVIVVQPGEKVPIDGVVVEGTASLNTSALTGESLPREIIPGEEVISGCIDMSGVLKIRTTKNFGESTVSKILELVEESSSRKSVGGVHLQICAGLYPRRVLLGAGAGSSAAGHQSDRGQPGRVGELDLPRADVPGHLLPLRAGRQHSAELLRGHRRREQGRCADQGFKLHGDAFADEDRGLRQDRYADQGCI